MKLSVIMPAFNAEKYIKQAIDSILAQTFQDFELIIINDGSTDDTGKIICTYLKNDRIRPENIKHRGIVPALNVGMAMATGDYIARHDADDWSHRERFERQVKALGNGAEIVGTSMLLVDKGLFAEDILRYPQKVTHELLMDKCWVAHPTVMMRREVYETIGGYDEDFDMGCCEDYDYWLRAAEQFSFIYNIDTVLYTKRVHDESNIGRAKKETIQAFNELARLKARIRSL